MSRVAIHCPVRGRDLETDLRLLFDGGLIISVFLPLGHKIFEAEKLWRIDAVMETGEGTWAMDGYDVRIVELQGAHKRVAARMMGAKP